MRRATNLTRRSAARRQTTSSRCLRLAKALKRSGIWEDSGTYRVIFTARLRDAVYVLHAFQKKTRATSKQDIEIAKSRYTELMRGRR